MIHYVMRYSRAAADKAWTLLRGCHAATYDWFSHSAENTGHGASTLGAGGIFILAHSLSLSLPLSFSFSSALSFIHGHFLMQVGALEASPQAAEPAGVDKVLTGLEFDELAAVEKSEAVSIMSVFARVEPSHKSRLVELLQAQV